MILASELLTKWNLDPQKLPQHVAIIMDGNGRWAKQRNMPRLMGHRKGVERVREITEFANNIGIKCLSLFAFSDENWQRPQEEISGLWSLLQQYAEEEKQNFNKQKICCKVIGEKNRLPENVRNLVENIEKATMFNTNMTLVIALSYGSQREIIRACQRIIEQVQSHKINPHELTPEIFARYLDTQDLPPVDLLIRTSGEQRISNFLLWQAAYAELFFEPKFWPDFDIQAFVNALQDYARRERRFGKISEQLTQHSNK